ncbi:MAG: peptidoglycan DD-metalloendopeptidase family protein [Treponema sp.]|nr:peptidoglycan DD-metalloendopeptidase family protein [Treponema sp.]
MASLIEKQRVSRRRKAASPGRHNNKSAGFHTGFMNQFNQKPACSRKKKSKSLFEVFGKANRQKIKINRTKPAVSRRSGKTGGNNIIPFFSTFAVAAVTVVIALAALNWKGIDLKMLDIYAAQPAEDLEAGQRSIRYAAKGIQGIYTNIPVEDNAVNETGDTVVNNNPHGSLVTFDWQQYIVQKGDSVSGIAKKFDVSVGAIIASNNISNARRLQEGTTLRIPNIDGIPYQVKKGDSLSKISTSFNVDLDVILDINDIKSDNIKVGETFFIPGARMNDIDLKMSLGELFTFPLQSRYITSRYGMRKDPFTGVLQFHGGVDFRANTGTTVMASLDGTVSVISENWLYGKYIIMSHGNGYKSIYGHLNAYSVKQGDKVARGRKIGEVGNTGYSTGPHLHFGIFDKNNRLVNPMDLLN